jgi:hypothetical protein
MRRGRRKDAARKLFEPPANSLLQAARSSAEMPINPDMRTPAFF